MKDIFSAICFLLSLVFSSLILFSSDKMMSHEVGFKSLDLALMFSTSIFLGIWSLTRIFKVGGDMVKATGFFTIMLFIVSVVSILFF